jgi:hypothetical protein
MRPEQWDTFKRAARRERLSRIPMALIADSPWIHQPFEEYDTLRPHQLAARLRSRARSAPTGCSSRSGPAIRCAPRSPRASGRCSQPA